MFFQKIKEWAKFFKRKIRRDLYNLHRIKDAPLYESNVLFSICLCDESY